MMPRSNIPNWNDTSKNLWTYDCRVEMALYSTTLAVLVRNCPQIMRPFFAKFIKYCSIAFLVFVSCNTKMNCISKPNHFLCLLSKNKVNDITFLTRDKCVFSTSLKIDLCNWEQSVNEFSTYISPAWNVLSTFIFWVNQLL